MKSLLLTLLALLLMVASARAQEPAPGAVPPEQVLPGDTSGAAGALPAEPSALAEPATDPAALAPVAIPEASIDPALLDTGGEAQLSAEELEELGFGTGTAETAVDTDLKFFGFADFSVVVAAMKKSNAWRDFIGRHSTFYIGNLNLFLSKSLSENVRTMAEVRFLYAPHGSANVDGSLNESRSDDHADFGRSLHWGGIEIERAYIEWTLHPNLTIRAGQYLTPYGIWNVDHGSPLFIPVQRPYVIGSSLFPERQTGFELFGKWDASTHSAIGYHLTLSNGMGPISEIKDLDDNKAVGGRLYWELRRLGEFRLGVSAYYGRDTGARRVQGLDANGKLALSEQITTQSDVLSLAADAQWKYRSLHLQVEGITQQRKYTDRGRYGAVNALAGGQSLFPSDTLNWGVYGIAGYRFDWYSIMPYVMVQEFSEVATNNLLTRTRGVAGGLNLRPIDAVVLKLEYLFGDFPDGHLVSTGNIHLIQAQVAWAF